MAKSQRLSNLPNAPAFSAYKSGSAQTISNTTFTKVSFQTEEFDTASCYDAATNYRFTPNVAGYYQFNASLSWNGATGSYDAVVAFYKNGSVFKAGLDTNSSQYTTIASALIYLNGTTDYVEVYAYQASGGSKEVGFSQVQTYFQGFLASPA